MSEIAELAACREETRAWLEANCPAEMREPMRDESDACWGGRNAVFKNDAQKRWMDVMAERGWTVPEILLSGHHERIREWRREQSRRRA